MTAEQGNRAEVLRLGVADAQSIADRIIRRQGNFSETLEMSIMVVLLNYGDHLTAVSCTAGEWSGVKGDLFPRAGIPQCPNGHTLVEHRQQMRLGLVPAPVEADHD